MARTLLLCFIHGFKGNDDTFRSFPHDLKTQVAKKLPDHSVESIVYPKYETKGDLGQCSEAFLSWLKEKVMEVRKAHCANPWPPHDRDVGVILVAHSMGGFVASDSLFLILNERLSGDKGDTPMFPLIQGILTFDTPFNGLARSMFVYGAFSNYQKVSSVFNVMTALSAAPAVFSKSAFKRTAASLPAKKSASPAWKGWQMVAVRTGTVGAIAAGGVLAYTNRQQILDGMRNMRNLNKESIKEGYQQSIDTLSHGLAYINRGNVGRSFDYLSDHFTFVGTLMKQKELSRRLERMASLEGVGIHDFYTSLGENGMWSGGYFIPERTFCAIPTKDHKAHHIFSRQVIKNTEDEVEAHVNMFVRDKNQEYERMTEEASNLVVRWFNDDSAIIDDPKFATPLPPEPVEQLVATTEDGKEVPRTDSITSGGDTSTEELTDNDQSIDLPDESPLDIAAAAAAVPLPDDDEETPPVVETKEAEKTTYMRYLMGIAQQAGTGVKSYVPTKMPEMPSGPSFKSMIPTQIPQMPSIFSRKHRSSAGSAEGSADNKPSDTIQTTGDNGPDALVVQPKVGAQPCSEPIGSTHLRPDPEIQDEPSIPAAK